MYKRIGYSLTGNLLRMLIALLSIPILANGLGKEAYGQYMYVFLISTTIVILLDFNFSKALFNKGSSSGVTRRDLVVFLFWGLLGGILSLFLVSIIVSFNTHNSLSVTIAIAGAAYVFLQNRIFNSLAKLCEIARDTRFVQVLQTVISLIFLIFLVIMAHLDLMELSNIFVFLIIAWFMTNLVLVRRLSSILTLKPSKESIRQELGYYGKFVGPMVPLSLLIAISELIERYMLERWLGFSEFANYSIAKQISMPVIVVITSFISVLWREYAEFYERDKAAFKRQTTIMINSSVIGLSLVVGAILPIIDDVVYFTLSSGYLDSSEAIKIALIGTIHQFAGQLLSVMLLITMQTRVQSFIGSVSIISSIVLNFILVSPNSLPFSLGLGAEGVYIKSITLQLISVIAMILFFRKKFDHEINLFFIIIVPGLSVWGFSASYDFFSSHVRGVLGYVFYLTFCSVVASFGGFTLYRKYFLGQVK